MHTHTYSTHTERDAHTNAHARTHARTHTHTSMQAYTHTYRDGREKKTDLYIEDPRSHSRLAGGVGVLEEDTREGTAPESVDLTLLEAGHPDGLLIKLNLMHRKNEERDALPS